MTEQEHHRPRPLALVTGASSGIGRALAREFAEHGYDLVVVADEPAIHDVPELRGADVAIHPVEVDLGTDDGVREVWRRITDLDRPLDVAALNAGVALNRRFAEDDDLADELRMIDINVRSTVHLAKLVLADMTARGQGRVLVTASVEAALPGPYQAVYAASKAFLASFAQAVGTEVRDSGVTVTTLLPGPTDTPIFQKAGGNPILATVPKTRPEIVARQAYRALVRGQSRVVGGSALDRLIVFGARFVPDSGKAALHAVAARPGSGHDSGVAAVFRGMGHSMAYVERIVEAPREDVFAVLANGWSYSDWVVGTAHIRAVDETWPQPGAQIHHKAGPWPVSLQDRTVALECEQPSRLVLSPHLWPLGEAVVTITLEEAGPGRTRVRMGEDFKAGPLRWVRSKVNDLALHYRNRESLRRLGDLARQRDHPAQGPTVDGGA